MWKETTEKVQPKTEKQGCLYVIESFNTLMLQIHLQTYLRTVGKFHHIYFGKFWPKINEYNVLISCLHVKRFIEM